MNKQELLNAAEVMRRAAEGELVECRHRTYADSEWCPAYRADEKTCWDWTKWEWRSLDFPAPPTGQSWHNPCGLSATQVGVHEGWRLLLISEIDGKNSTGDQEWWSVSMKRCGWMSPPQIATREETTTFRTKSPLPVAADPCEEACRKAFLQSWNSAIQKIWNEAWKAAKEQNNN